MKSNNLSTRREIVFHKSEYQYYLLLNIIATFLIAMGTAKLFLNYESKKRKFNVSNTHIQINTDEQGIMLRIKRERIQMKIRHWENEKS